MSYMAVYVPDEADFAKIKQARRLLRFHEDKSFSAFILGYAVEQAEKIIEKYELKG